MAGERARRLDERVLGFAGIALLALLVAVYFAAQAVESARAGAWLVAAATAVLAVLCGQAAVRTWRRRR